MEILEGTLEVSKVKEKTEQINSTIDLLSKMDLFKDYVKKFKLKIKTIIVCDDFGAAGRDRLSNISRPTRIFRYRSLDTDDETQRIAKYVYDKK